MGIMLRMLANEHKPHCPNASIPTSTSVPIHCQTRQDGVATWRMVPDARRGYGCEWYIHRYQRVTPPSDIFWIIAVKLDRTMPVAAQIVDVEDSTQPDSLFPPGRTTFPPSILLQNYKDC
jgi:hypothetical protein